MIFLIAAILITIVICLYCYRRCFYSENRKPADPYQLLHGEQYEAVEDKIFASTKKMDDSVYEPITIQSYDGISLYGRYYHHKDGAPVKIIFHGYRSMTLRDSAGGYAYGRKYGINVLAVDQRAHGNSGGHVITFGIKERIDCKSWAEYAAKRFGEKIPIILSGLSMGAATVVMATELKLPDNVCCVIADCPYASPGGIIRKVANDFHIPSALSYPFIWLSALILGHFSLSTATAVKAASVSKIPILLFHGEDDRFVPCEMSRKIHENSNGCTRLETFPEAGHGLCYMIDPIRYEKVCNEFLNSIPVLSEHITVV